MRFQKEISYLPLCLCGLLLLAGKPALAQDKKPLGVYVTLAGGVGTHTFWRAAIEVMQDQKWSLGFTYAITSGRSPNEPFDYDAYSAHGLNLFGPRKPNRVYDRGRFAALTVGRAIAVSETIRWHNRGGISYNHIEVSENFRLAQNQNSGWFSGPSTLYVYDKGNRNIPGLYLASSLEYAPPAFFGFTLGIMANINAQQSLVGLDIGILMGRAGKKRLRLPDS